MKGPWPGLAAVLFLLAALAAACGGASGTRPPGSEEGSATQTDDGAGSVTVEATWVTDDHLALDEQLREVETEYSGDDVVLLHVKMNTHSVNLSEYDLTAIATLVADGRTDAPLDSVMISDDQHHIDAVLVFQAPATASSAVLTLRDIGGVPERTLRWSLPPS